MRSDRVWQNPTVVNQFLTGVRAGIPLASEQIDIALRVIAKACPQIEQFIDLGCGDGILTQAMLTQYPQAKAIALDFSAPMLKQAQQRLQPFSKQVQYLEGDLGDGRWCETLQPVDVIISGYCIHHLETPRKQQLYREIYNQLKPGGCFINIEHIASASPEGETLFNELLIDSLYQWHQHQQSPLTKTEVAEKFVYREDKVANILEPVELQCQWLRQTGFEQVDCYFKVFELAVFGGIKPSSHPTV